MKTVLVDLLKGAGFEATVPTSENLRAVDGLFLRREWFQDIEVAFYGPSRRWYDVEVFVNQASGICRVTYREQGRTVKQRWHDTIGKRTYNAIAETVRCAGFQM